MTGHGTECGIGNKDLKLPLRLMHDCDIFFLENFFISKISTTGPNSEWFAIGIRIK